LGNKGTKNIVGNRTGEHESEGTHEQLNVDVDGGGNGVRKCIQQGTDKEKTRKYRAFLVGNR